MRLLFLALLFSLSMAAQTKCDTIKVFIPSKSFSEREIKRLELQIDSINTLLRYHYNNYWYREQFYKMKIN